MFWINIITMLMLLILMKTKTGQQCVAFAGGRIFNELPLDARKIESRIAFTSFLNEYFL